MGKVIHQACNMETSGNDLAEMRTKGSFALDSEEAKKNSFDLNDSRET